MIGVMELRLKEVREKIGITQEELGGRVGKTRVTIGQLENGRNWSAATLEEFARALGVEEWALLGYTHGPDEECTRGRSGDALDFERYGTWMTDAEIITVAEVHLAVHGRMLQHIDQMSSIFPPGAAEGQGLATTRDGLLRRMKYLREVIAARRDRK